MALDEKKLKKFEELASKRVQNALHAIRLIGNLSNRTNYAYTQGHVEQLKAALNEAVADVSTRFEAELKNEGSSSFAFVHTEEMKSEAATASDAPEDDTEAEVEDAPAGSVPPFGAF